MGRSSRVFPKISVSPLEEKDKFYDEYQLICKNFRLSTAMLDPCSHRYYLSIRVHDGTDGRLIMIDNIHSSNCYVIIRDSDLQKI